MPKLSDLPDDAERELAYRRGYVHGVSALMSGVVDKLSDVERQAIEYWFKNELTPWSRGEGTSDAPDVPRLDLINAQRP